MKVILARYGGFCPGVKRAWGLVEKAAKKGKKRLFIYGDLIHNRQAIEKLGKWGVKTINSLKEAKEDGLVVIRAHGEPPKTFAEIKRLKLKFIDATCPSVTRVQKLAQQLEAEGFQVIVCGEKEHPEARANVGYTKKGRVISSVGEARKLPRMAKVGVVSQTTFSAEILKKICGVLRDRSQQFKSLGTICNFTQMAQAEARQIAKKVDLIIVVGGKQSSNTKRLTQVSEKIGPTHQIETASELKDKWFSKVKTVGLLAGASTPDFIIREVVKKLKTYD
jgi:4-hydroxy-3-methylbut-2-enyl diphosphate reductase